MVYYHDNATLTLKHCMNLIVVSYQLEMKTQTTVIDRRFHVYLYILSIVTEAPEATTVQTESQCWLLDPLRDH